MNIPAIRGARVHAQKRAPTVDLVRLLELLAKAIEHDAAAAGTPAAWPLLQFDAATPCLRINTRGVLTRLFTSDDFKKDFAAGENHGFLRDMTPPSFGMDAKMGGAVHHERLADLAHAVFRLRDAIDEELARTAQATGLAANTLLVRAADHLAELAHSVGAKFSDAPSSVNVVPIEFAEPDRAHDARQEDVARLVAAVEEVETRDWLESFEVPVRRRLSKRLDDEDEVEGIIANVRREAGKLDSQVVRFLSFLDDEALSRVRLDVTFAIMEALKEAAARRERDHAAQWLVKYVANVVAVRDAFFDTDETLEIDASKTWGLSGKVNLGGYLPMARFFKALPVWPEWVTQMFEFRPLGGGSLAREVSYRFRINGNNPQLGVSALRARLGWYRESLLDAPADDVNPGVIARHLAEVVFLAAVIPTAVDLAEDPIERARRLAGEISVGGKAAVARLLDELERYDGDVREVARALVQTLQSQGKALVTQAEKHVRELYICVKQGVVDWARLEAATGSSQDFFIRPTEAGQSEHPLWLDQLVITDKPLTVPNLLFSVKVRTLLRERALTRAGDSAPQALQRSVDGELLTVLWRPFRGHRPEGGDWVWEPIEGVARWLASARVHLEYDATLLQRRGRRRGISPENQQQWHAAVCAAFALLAYVTLWTLRQAAAGGAAPSTRTLMVRMQTEGRSSETGEPQAISGAEVLYAAAQSVESVLACEAPVYMQGLSLANGQRWRDSGAFEALSAAFPLMLASDAAQRVGHVGLVSYATRPASVHPRWPTEDVYLYTAKSYVAAPVSAPFAGYRLEEIRSQTHLQSAAQFDDPTLIFEEIGRLRAAGCTHIVLLWHHYGNRRIGRTADRNAPHSKPDFLERVAKRFPDITLYPLRRDVFPATRMHRRSAGESGFEVARVREHEEFWHPAEAEIRRDLVPVYTFATLDFVGDGDARPQSGFCTYFLELDSRLSQVEWHERARLNLIDPNQDSAVRPALIAVLRGLHFLHAERGVRGGKMAPVLDPHDWIAPTTVGGAGELKVVSSRRKGGVVLSLPAVLAHVSTALRGGQR